MLTGGIGGEYLTMAPDGEKQSPWATFPRWKPTCPRLFLMLLLCLICLTPKAGTTQKSKTLLLKPAAFIPLWLSLLPPPTGSFHRQNVLGQTGNFSTSWCMWLISKNPFVGLFWKTARTQYDPGWRIKGPSLRRRNLKAIPTSQNSLCF